MTTDEKQPRIPEFHGRPGMYVKEGAAPALDGVQTEKDGAAGRLKLGEIAASGLDGANVAGPLYDDTTYLSQACTCLFMLSCLYIASTSKQSQTKPK